MRGTTRLEFAVEDVRRIVAHVRAASKHRTNYGQKVGKPSVVFVKDEGIYLMSSGEPRDMLDGAADELGASSFCAYAKGFDPREASYEWQMGQDAVGGDDFGEFLPVEMFEAALRLPELIGIQLHVSPRDIKLVVVENNPRSKHAKKGRS